MKELKIIVGKERFFEILKRPPQSLVRKYDVNWTTKLVPRNQSATGFFRFKKFEQIKIAEHKGKYTNYITFKHLTTIVADYECNPYYEIILGDEVDRLNKKKREKLIEESLDTAMKSLSTYGSHPIIEQQARRAKLLDSNSVDSVKSQNTDIRVYNEDTAKVVNKAADDFMKKYKKEHIARTMRSGFVEGVRWAINQWMTE